MPQETEATRRRSVAAWLLSAFLALAFVGALPLFPGTGALLSPFLLLYHAKSWLFPVLVTGFIVLQTAESVFGLKRGVARLLVWATVLYGSFVLVLALALRISAMLKDTSSFRPVGGPGPVTLDARDMAGSDRVTLAVYLYGAPNGRKIANIVTAPARNIVQENAATGTGTTYRLRLIGATPGVTWRVKGGDGVTVKGEEAIPPKGWRDFSLIRASDTSITMQSIANGRCPSDKALHRCGL